MPAPVRLNPPLTEEEILAFEKCHAIALPGEFRDFLRYVGNGGEGPFCDLFPLGKIDHNFDLRQWQKNDDLVGDPSQPFRFETAWNDLTGMPEDGLIDSESEYWRRMEAFEKTYWRAELVNGAIPICHEGCALRIWLVVTGPQRGFLWRDRRSEYGGMQPVQLANGSHATFQTWYEEWLKSCLAGQNANGTP